MRVIRDITIVREDGRGSLHSLTPTSSTIAHHHPIQSVNMLSIVNRVHITAVSCHISRSIPMISRDLSNWLCWDPIGSARAQISNCLAARSLRGIGSTADGAESRAGRTPLSTTPFFRNIFTLLNNPAIFFRNIFTLLKNKPDTTKNFQNFWNLNYPLKYNIA